MSISIKCNGANCSIKETCYRFTATPTKDQSYIEYSNKDGNCSGFMSEKDQIHLNGDIHKVGDKEYTRGKFGSFSIYTVKIKNLYIDECHYRRDGIQSYSRLMGSAYIPNTGLVGSWIPNSVSEIEITISDFFSNEEIDNKIEESIQKVRNEFNKNTLGYYQFDDEAIGFSSLTIGIVSKSCRIDLEHAVFEKLLNSVKDETLGDLEFDIKFYSIFTSTDVMSPEEVRGYLLANDGSRDGKSEGVVLEMKTKINAKELNIGLDLKIEEQNKTAKVIEGNIVDLSAHLLRIIKLCKYGFIILGILAFLNLLT